MFSVCFVYGCRHESGCDQCSFYRFTLRKHAVCTFCVVDRLRLTIRIVSSFINVNLLYLIVAYSKSDGLRMNERRSSNVSKTDTYDIATVFQSREACSECCPFETEWTDCSNKFGCVWLNVDCAISYVSVSVLSKPIRVVLSKLNSYIPICAFIIIIPYSEVTDFHSQVIVYCFMYVACLSELAS